MPVSEVKTMKFDEIYPDALVWDGFPFGVWDKIIKNRYERPCSVCGYKTVWSSKYFKKFFCSTECLSGRWDKAYDDMSNGLMWDV